MAINFPDSPSLNDIFNDETSGFSYQWDGEVWKSYVDATIGNVTKLDDISASFNSVTQTFPLTVNGTAAVADLDPATVLLSLGGVIQNPVQDYTISGTNITFTTPPANGLTFFATYYESGIPKDYISSGIVGPTGLSTGGFSWNTSGDLYISGVATVSNTGTASTALYVSGNARVAGILTVGSSSITFDGTNNRITGTGITISSDGIVSGIITATTYSGDGVNLIGAGLGTESSINTTGIITASKFSGDATYLTDVGGLLDGIVYSPGVGATSVALASNIEITFNKAIQANTGTITLRTDSATGTIIESFDVGTSSSISISGAKLTINPTASLGGLTTYFAVVPAGTVKDLYNTGSNAAINTYSFTTQQLNYELWIWGAGAQGQLGLNDAINYSSPTQIPGTQWDKIDSGYLESFATKTDGTLWAWGYNLHGQLGQNGVAPCSSPIQIPGTQWSYFGARANAILATKTDGTLWSWGINQSGSLGLNDAQRRSSPTQIPGTQWKVSDRYQVSAGDYQSPVSGAIKTDGTLWSWGYGAGGSLAQNNTTTYSSPIQIPGTQWNTVSSGIVFIATKTDGTLWSWGGNGQGGLGQNDRTPYSSPRQITGTQWNVAFQNIYGVLATKTDGTLWSWGRNNLGQLGQNNKTYYSSPTQIPGTQWNAISMGYYNGTSIKTNGEFWNWGDSTYGQLGQNSRTQYSSPVQVPGTQWYKLPETGTVYVGMAIKQVAP